MPRRIDVDPVRGLGEAIGELSIASGSVERRLNGLRLGFEELGDLLDSDTIKKLERYRSTQRTVSGLRKLVKDVDAYARAERMMARHPGSWRNADEVIAWEGRLRERNATLFRRHQAAVDEARGIRNPRAQHIIDLERRYGSADAAMILDAEHQAAVDEGARRTARGKAEGAYNFRRDRWAKFQREYFDDTVRYGGGAEGRSMAEQERVRKSDLLRSRAMRMQQLNAYRQFPWMKTLVDAGIIEKKEIPRISKNLARMSKAPILGKFIRHPSLLPLAAIGVATSVLSQSDRANPVVQKWSAAREIFGTPSNAFNRAARLAGFGSMEAVNEFYSRIVSEYGEGNADFIMAHIGSELMGAKPGKERESVMRTFNMNPQMARAAMFMTGRLKPSDSDLMSAHMSRLQDEITHGFSSDASPAETLRALWLSLGGKWVESRGAAHAAKVVPFVKPQSLSIYGIVNEAMGEILHSLFSKPKQAEEAAESLRSLESAGASISPDTGSGDRSLTFSIGRVDIKADNAQEFVDSLIRIGSEKGGIEVVEAFDRKEIA